MAWLDDHPPRTQQFRCPRRERPSGVIGVHTAESFPDETGPDSGAENVADFIRRRSSYGSYHYLADSDSIVHLIRLGCVAYHIATHGLNEHSIGISAATQAHKWDDLDPQWVDATVRNMARAAARAARWLQDEYGITVPARRISLSQARRKEPGFIAHADADPDRRTDPGSSFPWSTFLAYYADEMDGDDMPTAKEIADELANYGTTSLVTGNPSTLLNQIRWGYRRADDAANRSQPVREIRRLVRTLIEMHEDVDTDTILAKLDQMAAEDEQRDHAMADQLEGVAAMVAELDAGNGASATAIVEGIRELLHSGTAPEGESWRGRV